MFNIDKIDTVYIACGVTDLRKSIDGLIMIMKNELKLNPFEKALFVFCNKQMNRIKILHFDEGFWRYYYRLENGILKWPKTREEAIKAEKKELIWLLKGYEIRTKSKIKSVKEENSFWYIHKLTSLQFKGFIPLELQAFMVIYVYIY